MVVVTKLVVLLTAILVGFLYSYLTTVPPVPKLQSKWWGPGQPRKVDESIKPFKINVSEKALNDLKRRLKQVPDFTPPLEGIGFEYGFNSKYLQEVVQYWHDKYNWRQREVFLNSLPQFKTYVDGLDLHFIHVKPKNVPANTRVLPLLLLHGWPGSVREFYDVVPLLTTPRPGVDFVFEVVAPSLPGFGFSQGAAKPGLGPTQMAVVMKNLMTKLGFDKFYAQGGDWGSFVVTALGVLYKEDVLGIHLNLCDSSTLTSNMKWLLGSLWPTLIVDEEYIHKMYPISTILAGIMLESGYFHIQATKPDTIGTALRDSPTGLAAYILEKFSTATNPAWRALPDGGLTNKYKLDDLLDNIMIYWLSGSITTSVRIYSEYVAKENRALGLESIPVEVPTACAMFPHEISYRPPFILKDRYKNLVHFTNMVRGGHFAAFEEPQLLADDVWSAVKLMEQKTT